MVAFALARRAAAPPLQLAPSWTTREYGSAIVVVDSNSNEPIVSLKNLMKISLDDWRVTHVQNLTGTIKETVQKQVVALITRWVELAMAALGVSPIRSP